MRLLGASVVVCVLALASQVFAALEVDLGPRFDPAPVEIPTITTTSSRPVTAMDLLSLRDIHGIQISPNGQYVAFVLGQAIYETNSYRTGLLVVATQEGSLAISLGTAGPPRWDSDGSSTIETPVWSADSRHIYYRLRKSGTWQVWRWSLEGGKPVQTTHVPFDVQSFELSRDGAKLVLVLEKPRDPQEAKQMLEHGVLFGAGGDNFSTDFHPWESKPIVEAELDREPRETETWIQDIATGRAAKATIEEVKHHHPWQKDPRHDLIFLGKVSPNGNLLAYVERMSDLRPHLFVRPLGGGSPIPLFESRRMGGLWWSNDSSTIYFTVRGNDGRPPQLLAISATGGTARQMFQGTDFLDDFSADAGGTHVACTRENTSTPPEVAFVDLKTGDVRTLVDPNPELKNVRLSPATRVEWTNKYGEPGFGYLVKPLNYTPGQRYPLVVTTYDSGEHFLRGGVGDEFPIQLFAANGFAVLDFKDTFDSWDIKYGDFRAALRIWTSPMASLEAALKVLDDMGVIDPMRAGITGLSHGAEITVFTISRSHLFQSASVSALNGMDPHFHYLGGKSWALIEARWGLNGLLEGESLERWREVSAAMNMKSTRTPLLSNAPDSEFMISLQETTLLEECGKPFEMHIYPDELHIKRYPMHRYDIYTRNVDWFNFWLQGKEDPDPKKAGQYVRWRKLKAQHDWNERMIAGGKDPTAEFMRQSTPGAAVAPGERAPATAEDPAATLH